MQVHDSLMGADIVRALKLLIGSVVTKYPGLALIAQTDIEKLPQRLLGAIREYGSDDFHAL
jgi:hypothetical protein